MTTPKPEPASDTEVIQYKYWLEHHVLGWEVEGWWRALIARIDSDRARIRELEDLIIGKDEHFPACCCAFDEARREIKANRNAALKPEPGR